MTSGWWNDFRQDQIERPDGKAEDRIAGLTGLRSSAEALLRAGARMAKDSPRTMQILSSLNPVNPEILSKNKSSKNRILQDQ